LKPKPERGSISSNLLHDPHPSAVHAYIFDVCTIPYTTGTRAWGAWKLSLNSHLFGAAIWGHFVALFGGGGSENYQLLTVKSCSAVRAVGVLFVLISEFSERNTHHFLSDVHIVEALNEPVDNSGSEGAKLFVNTGNVL
jgi:hypothetical protein